MVIFLKAQKMLNFPLWHGLLSVILSDPSPVTAMNVQRLVLLVFFLIVFELFFWITMKYNLS